MQLDQLILQRRTVHDYKPVKVDWSIVEKALELSLWSLNHKLTFPWVYIRTGEQVRKQIAEVMVETTEKKKGPLSDNMKVSVRNKILNPSELIILGQKKSSDADQSQEDYATIACSVQIASLYLWEKGIGSKWTTSGFVFHDKTVKALGIDPNQIEIVGGLFVGIGEHLPKTPQRPPLSQFLKETL